MITVALRLHWNKYQCCVAAATFYKNQCAIAFRHVLSFFSWKCDRSDVKQKEKGRKEARDEMEEEEEPRRPQGRHHDL
jgi:hypothetical protein